MIVRKSISRIQRAAGPLSGKVRSTHNIIRRRENVAKIVNKGIHNSGRIEMNHIILILNGTNGISLPTLDNSLVEKFSVTVTSHSALILTTLLIELIKFRKSVLICSSETSF